MAKGFEEIAGDITVAWINAFGSIPNGTQGFIADTLTEAKVSQFYKSIYSAIVQISTTPRSQLKEP